MEKKKWGLGATIGDPEAGVPLHEEPKRIKSIPVWDVRAIAKELDAFDEKAVALDHEEALVILRLEKYIGAPELLTTCFRIMI